MTMTMVTYYFLHAFRLSTFSGSFEIFSQARIKWGLQLRAPLALESLLSSPSQNGWATHCDERILPEKWVVRYVSIRCLVSWALLIQETTKAVALTALLWDWAISLGDEVQYIWRCAAVINRIQFPSPQTNSLSRCVQKSINNQQMGVPYMPISRHHLWIVCGAPSNLCSDQDPHL